MLAQVFDEGAAAYDEYWAPALHRHARDLCQTLPALPPGTSRTVVDVATGAGTLVPVLREAAGPRGAVLALDRSMGMLRRAPADTPRIQADAARLPIADGCVDVAVFAFVLFMLPDARGAVAEAARVLRPGGWVLAATWGTQLESDAGIVVREEIDAAGAPSFPELQRSDDITATPEQLGALFGAGGFADVRTSARSLDAAFDADSVLAMGTGFGRLGWRYRRLDAGGREAASTRAAARLAALPAEAFVERSEVLLTSARRA